MKNIHVLPTDKPSRLLRGLDGIRLFENEVSPDNQWCVNVNIHVTNDEEIKDGDKRINNYQRKPKGEEIPSKKIILTTDVDLIKDGIQAINDEFLQWFVKNPSCESVQIYRSGNHYDGAMEFYHPLFYKIIIPKEDLGYTTKMGVEVSDEIVRATMIPKEYFGKEEPKQETLEEAAERLYPTTIDSFTDTGIDMSETERLIFINGAKWQQERMYSEEEIHDIIESYQNNVENNPVHITYTEWFEQFKKK